MPGAQALYLIGSLTIESGDEYSDIDMQLATSDFLASTAVWPEALELVGKIEVAWPVEHSSGNSAFTILFEGESYYHKVDVGLCSSEYAEANLHPLPNKVLLWRQDPARGEKRQLRTNAYVPEIGTTGHLLVGELLSAVRYVKARKRGHHLTCWRFAASKLNMLLLLLYEQSQGWSHKKYPLTTWDYVALDSRITETERVATLRALDCSSPAGMDRSLYQLSKRIIELAELRAQATGEKMPKALARRHLSFVQAELRVTERM